MTTMMMMMMRKSLRKSTKKDDDDDDDDDDGDDDDDDDSSKAQKKETALKSAKSNDHQTSSRKSTETRSSETRVDSSKAPSSIVLPETTNRNSRLAAAGEYLSQADAIKLARDNGGKGDVVQIDFEWDAARSIVTWDITFVSGLEYEMDAVSGKLIGTKPKAPAKIATLEPLALDGSTKLLSFQDIIQKAEAGSGKTVVEMELKRLKTRPAMFEVVMTDGSSILYDAATGSVIQL